LFSERPSGQRWLCAAILFNLYSVDNKAIAGILYETADLLEIDAADSFRIRSYRNAAQAVENHTEQIKDLISEPKKVLAIAGIGKGMLINLQELFSTGSLTVQADLLKKYHPSMLQLLKIQGLGPKTIALIWSAYQVCDVDGVEKLAREGKIRELPRMGEKHEQKLLKAIEDYRRISGQKNSRNISRSCRGSTGSRRQARCAGAARPWATSTFWSRVKLAAAKSSASRRCTTLQNIRR
jgi:hypothetical protein